MKLIFAPFKLAFKALSSHLKKMRKAWNLQLDDDHWSTILWIKVWAFIFGILAGILVYHLLLYDVIRELLSGY